MEEFEGAIDRLGNGRVGRIRRYVVRNRREYEEAKCI